MSNQIPELLARWATKRPNECRFTTTPNGDYYQMGDYKFWFSHGELCTEHSSNWNSFSGQPALDWLRGVVERAIEAAGIDYEYRFIAQIGISIPKHKVIIFNAKRGVIRDEKTVALLTAYVEWMEAQ